IPRLPEFTSAFPSVSIEIVVGDFFTVADRERLDAAIQVGELPSSRMIVRKLASVDYLVCGAPRYLALRGRPARPTDLKDHICLSYRRPRNGHIRNWRFAGAAAAEAHTPDPALIFNSGEALIAAATAGLGLMQVAEYYARPALNAGALVELLPDFKAHAYDSRWCSSSARRSRRACACSSIFWSRSSRRRHGERLCRRLTIVLVHLGERLLTADGAGAVVVRQCEEARDRQQRNDGGEQEDLVEARGGECLAVRADQRQQDGADRHSEAYRELLQHAAEAGGAAELPVRRVGVRQRIGTHELSRAGEAEDEHPEQDEIMRGLRFDQREAGEPDRAGDSAGDKHETETVVTDHRRQQVTDDDRADGRDEGDRAGSDRRQAEAHLQHQRQQVRHAVHADAADSAGERADAK